MASASRPDRGRSFLTLFSLMVLVGVEIFAVTLSGGWAIAGLFELGDLVGYGLMAVFSVIGAYLLLQLWQKASLAEGG